MFHICKKKIQNNNSLVLKVMQKGKGVVCAVVIIEREVGDIELINILFPKVFSIEFSYSLAQHCWGLLLVFDWLVH